MQHAPAHVPYLVGSGVSVLDGEHAIRPLVGSWVKLPVELSHGDGLGVHEERDDFRPASVVGKPALTRQAVVSAPDPKQGAVSYRAFYPASNVGSIVFIYLSFY